MTAADEAPVGTAAALRRRPWRDLLPVALIVALVAAIYGQTLGFAFISWDDPSYVSENLQVKGGLTWAGVEWALTTTFFSNWHPLTWLSHMAAWEAFGYWAGGHHLVNVVLHAIACILAFCFWRRAGQDDARALVLAVLLAIHPMHTETVAWLSDRKGLLAAVFWWASLLAYGRYGRTREAKHYALLLLFFVAALTAKPMAITLPVILLLLDYWPLSRWSATPGGPIERQRVLRSVADKIPLLLLAALAAAVTVYAQSKGGAVVSQATLPLVDRVTNAFVAITRYVGLLFWPQDLSFYFRYAEVWSVPGVIAAIAFVASVSFFAVWWRHSHPALIVGWLWFLVMLAPVIGIVQVGGQAMAARYMYVTSTGIFVALLWGIPWPRLAGGWRSATIAAALLAGVVLAVAAARQTATWRDSETLYTRALTVDPDNFVAHLLMAELLLDRDQVDAAEGHARRALAINDGSEVQAYGLRALGRVALARGRYDEARTLISESLRYKRVAPLTIYFLALAEIQSGRIADAERNLEVAITLRPSFANALAALAEVRARQGRVMEASALLQQAIAVEPRNVKPRLQWAAQLERQGPPGDALAVYREVLAVDRDNAAAQAAVARLAAAAGGTR